MIYIYENQKINNEHIKKFIKKNENLHLYFRESWGKIFSDNYVGFLQIENQTISILPKIEDTEDINKNNLKYLLFMLSKANNINLKNEDISDIDSEKLSIFEIFIKIFTRELIREFQRGIYKEYQSQRDNLTKLLGKYLVLDNLKFNFKNEKIYCEFDEFSENNELNQLFLFAIKYLQNFSNLRELKEIEIMLNEVTFTHIRIEDIDIKFNRLNERFKKSYELAILLLKHLMPINSKSKNSGFVFLFKMYNLFESFIASIVKDIYENSCKIQNNKKLCDKFNIKPDIVIYEDDKPKLIIDTKYKKVEFKKDIKESDIYQVFTYAKVYECENIILLYPKVNNFEFECTQKDVTLKVRQIDLKFETDSFREYMKNMRERLKNITDYKR